MVTKFTVQAKTGYAQLTLLKPHIPQKPDGYQLLVEAICGLASRDLKGKDFEEKIDAMDFFRSWWFRFMTNLDGEAVIQKLLEKGKQK